MAAQCSSAGDYRAVGGCPSATSAVLSAAGIAKEQDAQNTE